MHLKLSFAIVLVYETINGLVKVWIWKGHRNTFAEILPFDNLCHGYLKGIEIH